MSKPTPNERQREYDAAMSRIRETVLWRLDPHREVWQFEASDERPPQAPDWFFVVNHPRTGSSVTARLLNLHPQVYCGQEEQMLPFFMAVLGSELLIAPYLKHAVRYKKCIRITPLRMRHLLEGWRRGTSERLRFGDKGDMYYAHFGEACERVFPGCKFVLTVRRPLDTLSSYVQQPWASYLYRLYREPAELHRALRDKVYHMLERNRAWRGKAQVVVFEEMKERDGFEETLRRVLQHLGVDPDGLDWEDGWKHCGHGQAIGRWRQDPKVAEFLDWLSQEDAALREVLLGGAYYLPEELLEEVCLAKE